MYIYIYVKGIVHPKRKIHSLSTHYADGGVGELFESMNEINRKMMSQFADLGELPL